MDNPPPPDELYRDAPLYQVYRLEYVAQRNDAEKIEYYCGPLDAYCPACGDNSIFVFKALTRLPMPSSGGLNYAIYNKVFQRTLFCTRDDKHEFTAFFRVHNQTLTKIGQYPSIRDLNTPYLEHYRKILSNKQYRELNAAVGLYAHGVGIGAFVYLRRIFEDLIEEAHQAALSDPQWEEGKYDSVRMADKIELLRMHLPIFLVEQRALYSILSKGLHELSEEECKDYFTTVLVGIELTLDEKIREKEARAKIREAAKGIQAIHNKLSGKGIPGSGV